MAYRRIIRIAIPVSVALFAGTKRSANAFNAGLSGRRRPSFTNVRASFSTRLRSSVFVDEDDEDDDYDSYLSEFTTGGDEDDADWNAALGSLQRRLDDVASGDSATPAKALFNLMTADTPNDAVGRFVSTANPEVLSAMSGAVSGLLGGLVANPGVESTVRANGRRVASLCFQLQMTGYMFRNAEYVVALRDLMRIRANAPRRRLREAFDGLDKDGSGYIEVGEVEALLNEAYGDGDGANSVAPAFEVKTFLRFFDANNDGRVSWEEFERGLGAASGVDPATSSSVTGRYALPSSDDDDDEVIGGGGDGPDVSGTVEVEMEDGSRISVEAKDYIRDLKNEAQRLKDALRRETEAERTTEDLFNEGVEMGMDGGGGSMMPGQPPQEAPPSGGIAALIQSLGGDLKQLTEGISPEVVETMRLLIDFVIEGGDDAEDKNNGSPTSSPGKRRKKKEVDMEKEMELPGSALQQLALWQLVLGYRLREAEATGEYKRLLDN